MRRLLRPLLVLLLLVAAPLHAQPAPSVAVTWGDLAQLFHVKPDTVVRRDTTIVTRLDTLTLFRTDTVRSVHVDTVWATLVHVDTLRLTDTVRVMVPIASGPAPQPVPSPVVDSTPTPAPPPAPAPTPAPTPNDSSLTRYVANFAKYADVAWNRDGVNYLLSDYYDGAFSYYQAAQRPEFTAAQRAEFRRRADTIVVDYRTRYLEPNHYGAVPQWSLLRGLVEHYHLTGDTMSAKAVCGTADVLYRADYQYQHAWWTGQGSGEPRIASRTLQAQRLCHQLAREKGDSAAMRVYAARVDTLRTAIFAWQQPDGSFPAKPFCQGEASFMGGLMNSELIASDSELPDPRTLPAVRAAIGFLDTQWRADGSWNYMSVDCPGTGSQTAAPDVSLLITPAYWWLAKQTGVPAYAQRAEQAFAVAIAKAYLTGYKQFVENYADTWSALRLGWR